MDQEKPLTCYEQLMKAGYPQDSELTGPEEQQSALQNNSQVRQAGHRPPPLYQQRTPYDNQYFESGLGQVHRQHSYQQQRTPYDTQYFESGLGRVYQQHSHQQQQTPYDTQYFESGFGRVHRQHSHQQQRQQQPPYHENYPTHLIHTNLDPQQDQSQPSYHHRLVRTRSHQPQARSYHDAESLQTDYDQSHLLRAPPAPSNSAGSEFESMSRDELREWNKKHHLPISHGRRVLIQQAKTGIAEKVMPRGRRRREGGANLMGFSKSNVGLTTHGVENPEATDVNGPGVDSYSYDYPTATPEHGDPEDPTSLDDAGPSTSNP